MKWKKQSLWFHMHKNCYGAILKPCRPLRGRGFTKSPHKSITLINGPQGGGPHGLRMTPNFTMNRTYIGTSMYVTREYLGILMSGGMKTI